MAAFSLVGESCVEPSKYFDNNVVAGLVLLDAMRSCGVKQIVFSSTAATYGEPEEQPSRESTPTNPTNTYGETKLAFEKAMALVRQAYGLRYASLRYFNAAGAMKSAAKITIGNSISFRLQLQLGDANERHVEIYGDDYPTADGTCIRDYIHS